MRKQKWFTKAAASTLAVCMVGTTVLSGNVPVNVLAAAPVKDEWQQIQDVVGRYYGEWNEPTYEGLISNSMPDTALLGNGDVGITSGGNNTEKKFYISKGDFWSYGTSSALAEGGPLPIGGVTIKEADKEKEKNPNLAPSYKTVTASNTMDNNAAFGPDKAVDGFAEPTGDWHGWCTNLGKEQWLQLEFAEAIDIARYVVKSDAWSRSNLDGVEHLTTSDFQLQISDDGETWTDADVVEGNKEAVFDKNLDEPVKAKFVRLYITKPTQESDYESQVHPRARIAQFELYAEASEDTPEEPLPEQDFYEKQDILNAEIQTKQVLTHTPTEMTTWLAADKNIMVTELVSKSDKAAEFEVETWAADNKKDIRPITAENDENSVTVTRSTENRHKDDPKSWVSKAAVSTKIIGAEDVETASEDENGKGTLTFTLEPNEKVYIVTSVGGSGRTYTNTNELWEGAKEPVADAEDLLAEVTDEKGVADLDADREQWWKDYWSTSYVDLGTEDEKLDQIQKYYYGAQYILGSTTKEGELSPGLYGVWRTNDTPGWHGDYHLNYNLISTFYGAASSNRSELLLPAAEALYNYIPAGEERAASVSQLKRVNKKLIEQKIEAGEIDPEKGIEGALLYPLGIGPWGSTTDDTYLNEFLGAAYNSYMFTQYYEYTQDREILERAYEYLKKCAKLYETVLVKEDGRYNLYAGWCEGYQAKNPAIELAAAENVFRNVIDMSKILGVDEEKLPLWEEIYKDMTFKPTWTVDGKTVYGLGEERLDGEGGKQDFYFWGETYYPNVVMLDYFLPGGSLGYFSTPEELEIARNTLDVLDYNIEHTAGWSTSAWDWQNNFPRVYPDAVKARYDINQIINHFYESVIGDKMAANLRIVDGNHGVEKSGATEAINSMMLASDKGITKVFPNWYADKDAKFAHLRAKGAFTLSAEYDGTAKETKNVTVTSEKGNTMTLVSPWVEGAKVADSKGNEVKVKVGLVPNWETTENATITFDTVAGETYHVEKASNIDKSVLEAMIDYAETVFDQEDCTEGQWNAFQEEIAKAQAVVDKHDASSEEIAEAIVTLKEAIVNFDTLIADRVVLKELIETAKTSFNQEDYTAKQWNEFQKEIAKAQGVLNKDNSDRKEISDATESLKKAISSLAKVYPYIKVSGITAGSTFAGATAPDNMINDKGMSSVTELEVTHDNEGNGHTSWVTGANPGKNAWTQVDLGNVFSLDEMWIWNMNQAAVVDCTERGFKNVKIEYSTDGENWTALAVPEGMAFEDGDEDYPFQFAKASGAAQMKATNLNDGSNTPVSFGGAEARYVKITANPEAGNGSWGDVYYGMSELRFTVLEEADKSDLAGLIDYANSQKDSEDYKYVVPVVKKAFEKALAEAIAVNDDAEATQAEVDAAYDNLLEMVHMLGFTGNSESLKALADSARGLNPDLFTEETWAVLEDALEAADAVLANENALQDEIDAARDALQNAMDGLVRVPVDKDALKKLIDKAQKYVDKIDQYTDGTAKIFTDMLAEAVATYENEDASQKMVDAAYAELQQAIFQLRLKPNKDKLDDLIKAAEKVDTSKYTDESAAAFKAALDDAKAVFADGEATKEEVKAAEKALKEAQKNLVAKADKVASNDGNSNTNSGAKSQPKTGDATTVWTMLLGCMAAVVTAGTVVIKRKRQ